MYSSYFPKQVSSQAEVSAPRFPQKVLNESQTLKDTKDQNDRILNWRSERDNLNKTDIYKSSPAWTNLPTLRNNKNIGNEMNN